MGQIFYFIALFLFLGFPTPWLLVFGQMQYSIPNAPADLPQGRWPGAESNYDLFIAPPLMPSGSGSLKIVSTLAQLQSIASSLVPGDIVELADGAYGNGGATVRSFSKSSSEIKLILVL